MKFHIPDHIMRWLGPAVVIVIGFILVFGNPIGLSTACDGTDNCMVTWVGALSGWAALGGALLTVWVMRDQLAEQRRQTDYLTGNAEPEMFCSVSVEHSPEGFIPILKITVVNRNRRPLELHRLGFECTDPRLDVSIRSVRIGGSAKNKPLPLQIKGKFIHSTVPGKDDGAPAVTCEIECYVFTSGQIKPFNADFTTWQHIVYSVTLTSLLRDAASRPFKITASGVIAL